jgi:ketosteroid isomerase-like protein
MSAENVELAKRASEGDLETLLDLVADDVTVTDAHAPVDAPTVYRGRQGLLAAYERFVDIFDDFTREVDEYVEVGDWVITVGRWVGTAKGSGARAEEPGANAARFRDGRVVEWIVSFPDKATAMEAVRARQRSSNR